MTASAGATTAWERRRRRERALRWRRPTAVLTVLAVTMGGFLGARWLERRDLRQENDHRAEIAQAAILSRVQQAVGYADILRRLVATRYGMSDLEFSNFASNVLESVGLSDAAWAQRITAAQRARYERTYSAPIVEVTAAGAHVAPARSDYYPATFSTIGSSYFAPGLSLGGKRVRVDLAAEPVLRRAIVKATSTYQVGVTPPLQLPGMPKAIFIVQPALRDTIFGPYGGAIIVPLPGNWLLRAPGARDVTAIDVAGGVLGEHGDRSSQVRTSFYAADGSWIVSVRRAHSGRTESALPWIVLGFGLLLTALVALTQGHAARRRRVEEALGAAEGKYRALVEHLPVSTYVVSLEEPWTVLYVSPQHEELLGYPLADWLSDGHLYEKVLHPEDRHVLAETRLAHARGEAFTGEYRLIALDGRTVWVHDFARVVRDEDGRPLYSQGFLLDITAQKVAEAEQNRLEEELRQAQKMEAIGRLAGGIAHDFNNLLTAITGYAELALEAGTADDETRADLLGIRDAADRAGSLTSQLLTFSRRSATQPRLVDLNDRVAATIPMLARLIGEDVELDTRLAPVELAVNADPVHLEQVVLNLSLNGRDAMPEGGRLTITTSRDERAAHAVLTVSDQGYGMDEETQRHVFEPFFTTKGIGKGTGLGLSTVYAIVQEVAGTIEIESEPGVGTTFRISVPLAAGEIVAGDEEAAPAAPVDRAGLETILIVEDEDRVRALARRVLGGRGYTVVEAESGEAALELMESRDAEIDLVLTDVVMPGMTGGELAERLDQLFPSLPVVFMSGYPGESNRYGSLPPGARLIEKPFTPAILLERVAEALEPVPR